MEADKHKLTAERRRELASSIQSLNRNFDMQRVRAERKHAGRMASKDAELSQAQVIINNKEAELEEARINAYSAQHNVMHHQSLLKGTSERANAEAAKKAESDRVAQAEIHRLTEKHDTLLARAEHELQKLLNDKVEIQRQSTAELLRLQNEEC